jgi:SAM-dependent methyltransferase
VTAIEPSEQCSVPGEATVLRCDDGSTIALDVGSWSAEADAVDRRLLDRLRGPVLDIGCGPGRLVAALAERGVPALGVDASPVAVGQALARQAPALVRSVFDPLPGTGRWASALLVDGNVGIGGDPIRLLARTAELVDRSGQAVVEVEAPGTASLCFKARVERDTSMSVWFPWARVGADDVEELGAKAGLHLEDVVMDEDRWFARLRPVRRP